MIACPMAGGVTCGVAWLHCARSHGRFRLIAMDSAMEVFFVNGSFCAREAAKVSVLDRGFVMGDAIYEVVRVHDGVLPLWRSHYGRMKAGLGALGITMPMDEAGFGSLCMELAQRNEVRSGTVYLQITRGVADRTHLIPANLTPTVVGVARSLEIPTWRRNHPDGVGAITMPDDRWGRCDLKTTMLLANSLAKQQAQKAGAYEAILIGPDGTVREGASSGLFAVIDGLLHTHPADRHILPSITRRNVIQLAETVGIVCRESPLQLSQLLGAGEVFLTGTTTSVCPVVHIDDQPIGNGRPGAITMRLAHDYEQMIAMAAAQLQ